jgi:hypothetical protein
MVLEAYDKMGEKTFIGYKHPFEDLKGPPIIPLPPSSAPTSSPAASYLSIYYHHIRITRLLNVSCGALYGNEVRLYSYMDSYSNVGVMSLIVIIIIV